jgi:phage tail-like protein
MQSMRFQVKCGSGFTLDGVDGAQAGFMSVSTPEATIEAVEYREGTYNYPRKFPGNVTVADVSMSRGVALKDTAFWSWVSIVAHGEGEYRANIEIYHYNRSVLQKNVPTWAGGTPPTAGYGGRKYTLHEAFPIRCKIAGDLDASSSDISVQEIDVAFEYFTADELVEPKVIGTGNVGATNDASMAGTVAAGPAAPPAKT